MIGAISIIGLLVPSSVLNRSDVVFGQGVSYTAGHALLGPLGVAVGAALFTMMVVSNVLGLPTGEWKGVDPKTLEFLRVALIVLIVAMTIVATGNYFQQLAKTQVA